MTDTTGGMPPAGWYPDPYGQPFERWWDGTGWTEHTNTPAPAVAEPAAPQPAVSEPVVNEPASEPISEPAAHEPVTYEPVANEPAAYEPAAYEPAAYEPVAYEPPPLEEPPAATADPFAGFVSPAQAPEEPAPYSPAAYEPPAYEPPAYEAPAFEAPVDDAPAFEAPAYEAPQFSEPVKAYTPPTQGYDPEPVGPVFGAELFGQQQPTADPAPFSFGQSESAPQSEQFGTPAASVPAAAAGGVNAPSSFDFGFGEIISGGGVPSNASVPAPSGDGGLFDSWQPEEYAEEPRNGLASAGMTLGVLSFFLSALAGIPGLILSVLGIGRAARFDRNGDGPVGRGRAIAGLVLSIVGSALSAALILYGLQLYTASQQQPADASDEGGEVTQSETGAIGLEVGDMGTITLPDSDAAAIQFTVTAITTNFTCTAPDSISPENGQFVAVSLSFTLSPDYLSRMESGLPLHMNQSDWLGFVGDEGTTQVDSTDTGNSCIAESEQLPADFPAGENISGVIVLDMAEGLASVSYSPSGVTGIDPGMTRWEWVVPA
jgi:hypothetical protein